MSDVWTPPRAEVKDVGVSGNPDAPEIRRAHLNHEASIKAVGALYFLGSLVSVIAGVVFMVMPESGDNGKIIGILTGLFMLALAALYFWIARGLRRMTSAARIAAGVMAGIGLIGFPIGTLINGYVLYLLFSKKGTMVFSDEYKQIIADTPDIKYRTSIIVWIFLALLVGLILLAVIMAALGH